MNGINIINTLNKKLHNNKEKYLVDKKINSLSSTEFVGESKKQESERGTSETKMFTDSLSGTASRPLHGI